MRQQFKVLFVDENGNVLIPRPDEVPFKLTAEIKADLEKYHKQLPRPAPVEANLAPSTGPTPPPYVVSSSPLKLGESSFACSHRSRMVALMFWL